MTQFASTLLFFLVSLCCLCCAPARSPSTPYPTNAFEVMDDSNIALVQPNDEGGYHVFCSGVWISGSQFLTAAHCADEALTDEEKDIIDQVGPMARQLFSPEGRALAYVDWRTAAVRRDWSDVHTSRSATIVAVDRDKDLALLQVIGKPSPHSVASLSQDEIKQGDRIWASGNTLGLSFSLSDGTIGAVRWMDGLASPAKIHVIQVAGGGISFGNSGGALYDLHGGLIGICSFKTNEAVLSFFVHRDSISEFLKKHAG